MARSKLLDARSVARNKRKPPRPQDVPPRGDYSPAETNFDLLTEEERKLLSGPLVWPRISADQAYDRFIFRRPEIAYLATVRTIRTRVGSEPGAVYVRVLRKRNNQNYKAEAASSFWHVVRKPGEDDQEDVRRFLVELRRELVRMFPEHMDHTLTCQLMFGAGPSRGGANLLRVQSKWL